jgi:hypothetical protein
MCSGRRAAAAADEPGTVLADEPTHRLGKFVRLQREARSRGVSSGRPALGITDSGTRAYWDRYRRCSDISPGRWRS